jgi:HAD superfamily hydrolase (TIGR01549 family)
MITNNKVVIFDFNNTIQFTGENQMTDGFKYLAKVLNISESSLLAFNYNYLNSYIMGEPSDNVHSFKDEFESIANYFKIDRNLIQSIGFDNLEYNFFKTSKKPFIPSKFKNELTNLLDYLKQNSFRLIILSNIWHQSKVVETFLLENNLDKYFEGILTAGDCKIKKPNPKMFQKLKEKYPTIDFVNSFMIGDKKETDGILALKNNITSIILGSINYKDYNVVKKYFEGILTIV